MKVSDFKFADFILRQLSINFNFLFIDAEIVFNDETSDNKICIKKTEKYSETLFAIISYYIKNIDKITGQNITISEVDFKNIITYATVAIRDFVYEENFITEAFDYDKFVPLHLNKSLFVWMALRDIICPAFDKNIKNIKIVSGKSPYIDVARYIEYEDIETSLDYNDFPFIFLNTSVENFVCLNAFLLIEAIRAHELDPQIVIKQILNKKELRDLFFGLVKIAFTDEDKIKDFTTFITVFSDNFEYFKNSSDIKTAQYSTPNYSGKTWWFLGLIEKLLAPARGTNWEAHEKLQTLNQDLWEKIEDEKERRGLDPLPYELLLRVQSDDFSQDSDKLIQTLLSDVRIW